MKGKKEAILKYLEIHLRIINDLGIRKIDFHTNYPFSSKVFHFY